MNTASTLLAALVLLLAAPVSAQTSALTVEARFDAANTAYFTGDFAAAIEGYEELVQAGVDDADVYYNLASAYAELGKYGHAVGNFERALFLEPSDGGAGAGLDSARDVLAKRQSRANTQVVIDTGAPFSEALVRPFSERFLAFSFLLFHVLLLAGLGAFAYFGFFRAPGARGRGRVGLGLFACSALFFWTISGAGVLIKNGWFSEGVAAVVVSAEHDLREGPDPRAGSRGTLFEGERARILARDGDYARVRVSNAPGAQDGQSREGWVHQEQVLAIAPESP